MDLFDALFTRRSIRKYTSEPLTEDQLRVILRAGCYAPSAHNRQPWHFVVVRDPVRLAAIAAGHPYAKMLPQSGCAVLVCGDKQRQTTPGFLVEDCSAAIQNMLLAAHGLGLGAVWCGIHPVTRLVRLMKRLLGLPPHIVPIGLLSIGNKAEERSVEERFDPSKVHWEQW
jgi:nitroreductase